MNILQKVKSFLFGLKGTRDNKDDSVMTQFDLIDPKKIKNLHNIDQVAKENGEQEIPSSKEKIPDSLEEKVLSTIKTIELNGEHIAEAFAPMSVTMTLQDEIDTSRGDMIVRENNVPEVGQDLEVLVTWMSSNPLQARTKVVVKHTTNECMAMVKELKYKVDINTLHRIENIDKIEMNDIGRISLRTSKPLFYDVYKKNRKTGSIIIIDEQTNETIGAGMII